MPRGAAPTHGAVYGFLLAVVIFRAREGALLRRQYGKAASMASQTNRGSLNDMVLEALRYRRWRGGNENPSLGDAVVYVEKKLLQWAQRELAGGEDEYSPDVENLVADAGLKAVLAFGSFTGTTGGEFFEWVKEILTQLIINLKRLREAVRNGGLRHQSLERNVEAAALASQLVSPDDSLEQVAVIHEAGVRLKRAMRSLSTEERRVVKLHTAGRSLREIAATFRHAPSWGQTIWEAAAHKLRAALLVGRRVPRGATAAT